MSDTTLPIEEFTFRGITMQVFTGITDSRGRAMYYVTVDGETVGKGYSVQQAKDRAKKRMA